jgi:AraC-like DNA-binding protein
MTAYGRRIWGSNMTKAPEHHARVFGSPWNGVYCTHIESGRHFGRHWHATYGFGFLEHGAHSSASGRGNVDAYAGDVITTNPGEVHDGRPLGGASRRWRIVYVDCDLLSSISRGRSEITRPVIQDARLRRALQRLFHRVEHWSARRFASAAEALACEESLVEACALLMARYGTARPSGEAPPGDVRQVHDRLADDPFDPPTLADMAKMAGLSRYQVLRRFESVYGLPPHAWLLRQRAERARALIRDGSSLAEAAASSGFSDQSHMTRIFVRQFGFTPGAWRRAVVRAPLQ